MLGVVATALLAAILAMSGAAAHAQNSSGGAASETPAQPAQGAPVQGDSPAFAQEPPSATAGVRIITRPQDHPTDSQETSTAPASAEAEVQSPDRGKYLFERAGDKFLRLDQQTGQVALCNQEASGWDCRVVPEHPAALEKEIARLGDDIRNLKELQQKTSNLDQLRAELDALKQLPQQVANLTANLDQLRSETQDLKRLRAEVEDLKPLRAEVDGLNDVQTRIDDLMKQVANLRAASTGKKATQDRDHSSPASKAVRQGGGNDGHSSPQQTIDRAVAFISDAWRRLVDMISNFQKEAMRRS